MSAVAISISQDQVFTDVIAVCAALLDVSEAAGTIEQGQQNRLAMPTGGFVILTPMNKKRLSTNVASYVIPTGDVLSVSVAQQFNIQIDCYGVDSGDWASILQMGFRDQFAFDLMVNSKPLYADDPIQLPLVNGEEQYEERWTLQLALEYTPAVTLPMQFATSLKVGLIDVDVAYPP